MSTRIRQGWVAGGCLAAAIVLFFGDMIFYGRGFFYGDYRMQYYPWALELSRCLKNFSLPFWSDKIGCGFPLMAEGQIGALHPLKWILYGLFPIEQGYPLGFLTLFLAAGWFSYALLRRLGGSWSSGIVAALTFCYGSAYAGLAWGNPSLWVLAWLPWAADRAEALCQKPGSRRAAKLALVAGLMWLGGLPQIALYATLFIVGYVFVRGGARWWVLAACGLAAAIAAAQILPTLELVSISARSQTGLDFALQKSLNPANLASLVQPGLGFFGADIYIGILPLILAVFALGRAKRAPVVRTFAVLIAAAFAFALGKWNPIYSALIQTLHLFSLRAPSKWILFALFGLAVLAGLGWDAWWDSKTSRRGRWTVAAAVLGVSATVWLLAHIVAREFVPALQAWAEHYVRTEVYGRGGHPHSMQDYLSRITGYLQILKSRTDWSNYYFVCTAGAAASVVGWLCLERWNVARPALKTAGLLLILADLFLFSFVGSGFRGNRTDASVLASDAVTDRIIAEPGLFRVYEFTPDPMNPPRWIPNSNLILDYASIGLYTPLAPADYIKKTKRLGAVDDSSGARADSDRVPMEEAALLRRLNVRFMISGSELRLPDPWQELLRSEAGLVLYQDPGVWPRAYEKGNNYPAGPGSEADVIESRGGYYRIETRFAEPGVLVVSENGMFAPRSFGSGWRASVDGKPARIQSVDGGFISMPVDAGTHLIVLRYVPVMFWAGLAVSMAALLIAIVWIKK